MWSYGVCLGIWECCHEYSLRGATCAGNGAVGAYGPMPFLCSCKGDANDTATGAVQINNDEGSANVDKLIMSDIADFLGNIFFLQTESSRYGICSFQ